MNKWIGMGRATRDPEIRYTQGDDAMAIARITLAVDRRIKREGEPTADFINCVAFKKQAEFIEKYCKQGTKLVIEGRWQTGNYTNKDGVKVYTNECMIESLEFAESKGKSEETQTETQNTAPSYSEFMSVPDQDLPFN